MHLSRLAKALRRAWKPYLPPEPPKQFDVRKLSQAVPDFLEQFSDRARLFDSLAREYSGLSADQFDPIRLVQFFNFVDAANKLPPGDYAEFGTFGGLTLKVIHKLMDPQQTLYSFDTFEGFDKRDIAIEKTKYAYRAEQEWFSRPDINHVARYVGDGTPPSNLQLVKGWFPESYNGFEHKRWRFVHIDFDLYQPIKAALTRVWDQLLPGGIVLIHDYGCYGFPAARMAVDEFGGQVGFLPIELPDRWGTAILRKPGSAITLDNHALMRSAGA